MNRFGLKFHHLGLAVRSPEPASRFLDELGYTSGLKLFDPVHAVNVAMKHHASMPDIELIWPGSSPSPVDKLIAAGRGQLYHMSYLADDAADVLREMEKCGIGVFAVTDPAPSLLFGGAAVAFYQIDGFGLVEIVDLARSNARPG